MSAKDLFTGLNPMEFIHIFELFIHSTMSPVQAEMSQRPAQQCYQFKLDALRQNNAFPVKLATDVARLGV